MTDEDLAADLAIRAGALLVDLRASSGLSGGALGAAGDARANDAILAALGTARPDDAVLSEESTDSAARLSARRVWIIDPLDGTREYRAGRNDWAVHVALSIDGEATLGAVALPARDIVLRSDQTRPLTGEAARLRIATSRSRPAPVAAFAAERLGGTLVHIGSAGAKTAAVIMGEADAYLHSGAQSEWDNCAPVAVAQAAGLHCSRLDGAALRYNRADVVVPDILICHPARARQIIALASEYRASHDDEPDTRR
ncbi:3'(2'),5'-bisphosphate nucleotidase CysQ [Pacificimonas sp. WHA3]|uniref:3'(2'),5-bisphosphonucleoside 3'(2')-phosphohydrolase n=1 Tax=Pacificimonas pallii TaxID=2827236 RepID=A0ABS6SFV8_9SPHN|nr:3'(2'),5'-bisphosphate nucleotidase CysQ [Pacificimonas pallii]MBV7257300.1 3'(2'),5'-bisphosphate nucleotidase CysQ [Pacificimonas pallii]